MMKRKLVFPVAIASLIVAAMTGAGFSSGLYASAGKNPVPAVAEKKTDKSIDEVIMTVDGKNIYRSEFEYLYKKNLSQQENPQTFDDYISMFVDFKLKVADAEAAGLDTTAAFRTEFNQFLDELSSPYLKSAAVEDSLVAAVYNHFGTDVEVSHIMFPLGMTDEDRKFHLAKADSVYKEIMQGNLTFERAASLYSIDGQTAPNGGKMGILMPARFPWAFEEAAYALKEGEISRPVDSGVGFHIIRAESVAPTEGEVLVSHILKLTRGLDEAGVESRKAQIDSIAALLAAGAPFEDMAMRESEDPGSAKNGGALPWFGKGMMVKPFEKVAFEIKSGEISQPFRTDFGYHIIKKLDARPMPDLETLRPQILASINSDSRALLPARRKTEEFAAQYNASIYSDNVSTIVTHIDENGAPEEMMTLPVFTIEDLDYTLEEAVEPEFWTYLKALEPFDRPGAFNAKIKKSFDEAVVDKAKQKLYEDNPDYRHLVEEYRDGILLFDISSRNVWDKASKDTSGLENFFRQNKERYTWDVPKYKGFIIFAHNDSIMDEAVKYAEEILPVTPAADVAAEMQKKFNRQIKIERVIAAKGDNPISDYLVFSGPRPAGSASRWEVYRSIGGKIIPAPEEAADVRGAVVADYQNYLEKQWLEKLHKQYKVKLNRDLLKKISKSFPATAAK